MFIPELPLMQQSFILSHGPQGPYWLLEKRYICSLIKVFEKHTSRESDTCPELHRLAYFEKVVLGKVDLKLTSTEGKQMFVTLCTVIILGNLLRKDVSGYLAATAADEAVQIMLEQDDRGVTYVQRLMLKMHKSCTLVHRAYLVADKLIKEINRRHVPMSLHIKSP